LNTVVESVVLLSAGSLAGLVGTAGGITSFVSYPALLAVGVSAISANASNIVALVACWPGSALASRAELTGRGSWLLRWLPVAAAGGAGGAALLLWTPTSVFVRVVPFLLAVGSLTLLAQPKLAARRERRRSRAAGPLLPAGLVAVSVYNGYFGAGSGVMALVLMLLTVDDELPTANALKNMLIGAATVLSAIALVVFGSVDWAAVVPLGIGMFLGSTLGPRVVRRVRAGVLRWVVAFLGMALAIELLVRPGG
jgi:uncharacterized protein